MPLPPEDHPCMGYVCSIPDGTIPGWTISDCQQLGYSGNLAGCVDPRCKDWATQIARCWPSWYTSASNPAPPVYPPDAPTTDPFAGFLANDMIYDGTGRTGGCGCGGAGAGPLAGLGPNDPGTSSADYAAAMGDCGCGCEGDFFKRFPWWLLILIIILVVKWS